MPYNFGQSLPGLLTAFRLSRLFGPSDNNQVQRPFRNLFQPGPLTNQEEDVPTQELAFEPTETLDQRARRIYAPSTKAQDAYEQLTSNVPNRDQYKSGWAKKILAGIAGAATGFTTKNPMNAYNATSGILDSDYKDALEEYKLKEAAARNAATIEGQRNTSGINASRYQAADELAREKEANLEEYRKESLRLRGMSEETKRSLAQARIDKLASEGKKITKQLIDPRTGEVTFFFSDGTRMPTGLTDTTTLNTGRRISAARELANLQHENRSEELETNIRARAALAGSPTVRTSKMVPQEENQAQILQARKIKASNPELAPYITDTGEVIRTTNIWGKDNTDEELYKKALELMKIDTTKKTESKKLIILPSGLFKGKQGKTALRGLDPEALRKQLGLSGK